MKQYSRVSYAIRCQIYAYLQTNLGVPAIARRLGFNKSTIYRELKRNTKHTNYTIAGAEQLAQQRKRRCRRKRLLCGSLLNSVVNKLENDWSPEQITQRYRREGVPCVSHETIYKFMRSRNNIHLFRYYNRRGFSRYSKTKMRPSKHLSIHQRPEAANQRRRFGDWERDSMIVGKDRLLVCTDRKSRLTKFKAYKTYTGSDIGRKTLELIKPLGRAIYTITNDNGPEFRGKQNINVPIFYCDPRRPYQRGTVENTIGRLRRRLKLKTDLASFGKNGLRRLEREFNLKPRKCLDYRTPYEVFFNVKVALVT